MIDNDKIYEASRISCNAFEESGMMAKMSEIGIYRDGFRNGVNWFREKVWHDAKEPPRKNMPFLTKENGKWVVDIDTNIYKNDWAQYCEKRQITKWCYIEEMLLW